MFWYFLSFLSFLPKMKPGAGDAKFPGAFSARGSLYDAATHRLLLCLAQHPLVIFYDLLEAQAELVPSLYLGEYILRDIPKSTFVSSHSVQTKGQRYPCV